MHSKESPHSPLKSFVHLARNRNEMQMNVRFELVEDNYFVANYPLGRSLMVDLITFRGTLLSRPRKWRLLWFVWARFYGN